MADPVDVVEDLEPGIVVQEPGLDVSGALGTRIKPGRVGQDSLPDREDLANSVHVHRNGLILLDHDALEDFKLWRRES